MPIISRNNTQAWGDRAAIRGTLESLKDLKGNNDGLWGNEDKPAGTVGDLFDRQPLLNKAGMALAAGISTRDEIGELKAFVGEAEARWGQPVLDAGVKDQLKHGDLYAAQKAIILSRMDRAPGDVQERFVQAAGSVNGEPIAARRVFTQLWEPKGEPSGHVVVLSPGFQETWRNFVEQIDQLNAKGHAVLVMDHQWAGDTEGSPGGLDRGFGVARDVAAVAAEAATIAEEKFGASGKVLLMGNSMGAGPGVLGAATLNDAGLMQLEGKAMPKHLDMVLQAPFLAQTPSKTNALLSAASKLPFVNRLQAPSAGVPDLTDDKVAEQKGAQDAILSDTRAQLASMSAALDDLAFIKGLIADGEGPQGNVRIIHGARDPLADPAAAQQVADLLARRTGVEGEDAPTVAIKMLDSGDHVLEQSPGQQGFATDAVEELVEIEEDE